MSAMSLNLTTAFFGLAKRDANPFRLHTLLPLPLLRSNTLFRTFRGTVSVSAAKPLQQFPSRSSKRFLKSPSNRGHAARLFTASAAATESESADVLTQIPPDNRIPATIITGFLGSGKVTLLPLRLSIYVVENMKWFFFQFPAYACPFELLDYLNNLFSSVLWVFFFPGSVYFSTFWILFTFVIVFFYSYFSLFHVL